MKFQFQLAKEEVLNNTGTTEQGQLSPVFQSSSDAAWNDIKNFLKSRVNAVIQNGLKIRFHVKVIKDMYYQCNNLIKFIKLTKWTFSQKHQKLKITD
jgi:hypothetical protein